MKEEKGNILSWSWCSRNQERERAVRQIGELCNWYFCSFSALMLYSWYLCFFSTLLSMLCNCPATDSFARSFLSFYSQSAVRPQLESGPPWHLQMQVHDFRVIRMFEENWFSAKVYLSNVARVVYKHHSYIFTAWPDQCKCWLWRRD